MSTASNDCTSEDDDHFVVEDDEMEEEIQFPELKWSDICVDLAVHGDSELSLEVSSIPGAGIGVFADSRGFEAGEPITEYYGRIICKHDADQAKQSYEHTHIVPLFNFQWYIDGLVSEFGERSNPSAPGFPWRGLGAFVNSSRGSGLKANARFDFCDDKKQDVFCTKTRGDARHRHKYVRAIRYIAPGEEILVDYKYV